MTQQDIISLIKTNRDYHNESYHNYLELKLKSMDHHDLENATKYDDWAKQELALYMEYDYLYDKIQEE